MTYLIQPRHQSLPTDKEEHENIQQRSSKRN